MGDVDGLRYQVLALLGEGGFGRVYRARFEGAHGFHKDVAVKVIRREDPPASLLRRFRDESRILGLVRDRAVVSVEPPVRIGHAWALVMDFVDGQSLEHLVGSGPLPAGVAVEIVGEIARALHNVFNMEGPTGEPLRLLHRDIKPGNIQLTPAGEVKLLDFGIARADFDQRESNSVGLGGTPGYIAPERLQGDEGPHGDVYSLGVLLHQIVLGERPAPDTVPAHDDPLIQQVLELAASMRASDPSARPSARDVEKTCRRLRQLLDEPYLRDWSEAHVLPHFELPPDPFVGQTFTAIAGEDPLEKRIAPAAPGRMGLGVMVAVVAVVGLIGGLVWGPGSGGDDLGPGRVTTEVVAEVPRGIPLEARTTALDDDSVDLLPLEGTDVGDPEVQPAPASVKVQPGEVVREAPPTVDASDPPGQGTAAETDPAVVEIPLPPQMVAAVSPGPTWRVTLLSIPLGAEVTLVDGDRPLGRAPVVSELPSGTYKIRMSNGSRASVTTIKVGRTKPTRYVWRVAEDRWESGY